MDCIVHGATKSRTQLNDFWGFPGSSVGKESVCTPGDPGLVPGGEDPLEKEMATDSSILVWKTPWTEEPGQLQSMALQRVRLDLATKPAHYDTRVYLNKHSSASPFWIPFFPLLKL